MMELLAGALSRSRHRLDAWVWSQTLRRQSVILQGPIRQYGRLPMIANRGTFIIGGGCCFSAPRVPHQLTVATGAKLTLGAGSFLNEGVNIFASSEVRLGTHCKIGDMVNILDTDFHQVLPGAMIRRTPVLLGNNVWVGIGASILAGSEIGDHAVIGAGSVVKGKIPARSIAVGVPARVVRTFEAPDSWIRE